MPERGLLWQGATYVAFGALVALLSGSPSYAPLRDGEALLRVSLHIPGEIVGTCRVRAEAELARLPPNMRDPLVCPRRRAPVRVRLELDGRTLADEVRAPSGLAHDGAATLYRRLPVPAGAHTLHVRIARNAAGPDFDHERLAQLALATGQVLTIDFDPAKGGILLR